MRWFWAVKRRSPLTMVRRVAGSFLAIHIERIEGEQAAVEQGRFAAVHIACQHVAEELVVAAQIRHPASFSPRPELMTR